MIIVFDIKLVIRFSKKRICFKANAFLFFWVESSK
jgi:hypothetical protein